MALFQMKWLRRIVRRHTAPIDVDRAALWKKRISIGYAVVSWHAFGLVCYMFYTGRGDWAKDYKSEEERQMSPGQYFAKHLNVEKGKIIRYSGLTRVGEVPFDNNDDP